MTASHRLLAAALVVACIAFFAGHRYWEGHNRLKSLTSECPAAANAKDWKTLEARSMEWLKAVPESPHAKFWLGEALQNQGRFEESLQHFLAVDLEEPRGVDAAIRAMHIQLFVKQVPSAALTTAAKLLAVDPTLAEPIRVRIYIFAMTFQRDKLLEEINTAIQHRADLPEHFVHLMLLEDLSFRDGAEVVGRWLDNDQGLTDLLSDSLFAHSLLSQREAAVGLSESDSQESLSKLREKCRNKLESRGNSAVILELAIRLELEAGNYQMVEKLLERVPESSANDPVLWLHRGKYSLDQANIVDAESALERAIELLPTGWKSRGYLASVKRLKGEMEVAGELQKISKEGARIVGNCILLKKNRDVPKSLLIDISAFAKACNAPKVTTALARRVM